MRGHNELKRIRFLGRNSLWRASLWKKVFFLQVFQTFILFNLFMFLMVILACMRFSRHIANHSCTFDSYIFKNCIFNSVIFRASDKWLSRPRIFDVTSLSLIFTLWRKKISQFWKYPPPALHSFWASSPLCRPWEGYFSCVGGWGRRPFFCSWLSFSILHYIQRWKPANLAFSALTRRDQGLQWKRPSRYRVVGLKLTHCLRIWYHITNLFLRRYRF